MTERKLRSSVHWQRAIKQEKKGRKTDTLKTMSGCKVNKVETTCFKLVLMWCLPSLPAILQYTFCYEMNSSYFKYVKSVNVDYNTAAAFCLKTIYN
jgi:hypothetical protein